jgi:hypothetical protein
VALLVCALDALPGAASGVEGAPEQAAPGPGATPDAAVAPVAPAGSPDGGSARADRRRLRHQRRFGLQPDGGTGPDAGPVRDAGMPRFAIRDGGIRPPVVAPPVHTPPPPPPPAPVPVPSTPSTSSPVTELGFNTCKKIPAGKRAVKVNLKPDVELPELVAWISSITCKSFVLPGHLSAGGKKITFVAQNAMTPREAYSAFLTALDSVGLTVEQGPGFLKIIETAKAKSSSVPVYGFDGKPAQLERKRAKPAKPAQ